MTILQQSKALLSRLYSPDQIQRVSHILDGPELPTTLDISAIPKESLIELDEKTPPRLLIVAGLISPEYFSSILKDSAVNKHIKAFVFIENNSEVISKFLNWDKFAFLASQPILKFLFNHDINSIKAALFGVLRQPQYSAIMECAQLFYNKTESQPEVLDFYTKLEKVYDETVFHVYHNYGNIDDSVEGVRASFSNQDFILENPGWTELKDLYKGYPGLVVAAGPSLDYELEALKQYKDRAVIIAADAAVKPLLKAGIEPQFCTSIERGNIYQKPFWEGLGPIKTELVAYPVVHDEVLKLYPGPKRVVYRNYTYYAYLEQSYPRGIAASGGSTSHLALRLAEHLGCSKILLVAKDNSYEERADGMVRSHCNNLGYEAWAQYKPVEDFSNPAKGGQHAPAFKAPAFDGSLVWTNLTYHQWAKECDEHIMMMGLNDRVFISNPKAVKFSLAKLCSIKDFLDDLSVIPQHPDIPRKSHILNRSWDHKILHKSLINWNNILQELKNLIGKARLVPPNEDVIFNLHETIAIKLTNDTMFVGFIIQNCAVEFYQLQNDWMALPNELTSKYLERLDILQQQADLFSTVLTKVLTALDL